MSYASVAAALALGTDVSGGERLAAFSLASFANREHRAWPGTRIAAARAGLSRSQFLAGRDALTRRGLVVVEHPGGGRGNAPTVFLAFAASGVSIDLEVNAPLFDAVLSYSRACGSARLLLGALAALAADDLTVAGVTTQQLRAVAGMADSTYRRARAALLASDEVVLEASGGGRAKTNCWVLRDPRGVGVEPLAAAQRRPAVPVPARPLIAAARVAEPAGDVVVPAVGLKGPGLSGVSAANPGQGRTVWRGKRPGVRGVSTSNPGQGRTVSRQTPPVTPSQTPPLNARAGREPRNHHTVPPGPPDGGSQGRQVSAVEDYLTDRARRRQRTVTVDLDTAGRLLRAPTVDDLQAWAQIRRTLRQSVGESRFEIWLDGLELVAVDHQAWLLLRAPGTRGWVAARFARVLDHAAQLSGRKLRFAEDRELQVLDALTAAAPQIVPDPPHLDQEAV